MFSEYASSLILVVGALAFLTSVVTQVLKTTVFPKVPTDLVCFVISECLSVAGTIQYLVYSNIKITVFYIFASLVLGCLVKLVASSGWSSVRDIWNRTYNKEDNK